MSTDTPDGRLGRATRIVKDHPVVACFALFTGALVAARVITRRSSTEIVELPELKDKPSAAENLGDLASTRDDDGPLKDAAHKSGTDGKGDDPISSEIRP